MRPSTVRMAPISWTGTMFGWDSLPAILPSDMKRSIAGPAALPGSIILRATVLPRSVSCASTTFPRPPRPISSLNSYLPPVFSRRAPRSAGGIGAGSPGFREPEPDRGPGASPLRIGSGSPGIRKPFEKLGLPGPGRSACRAGGGPVKKAGRARRPPGRLTPDSGQGPDSRPVS